MQPVKVKFSRPHFFKLVLYRAVERHSQLFWKVAFVVMYAPCLWSWRVIRVCCYQLLAERHCASLHSFRLCPQSLINAAQAVSPSFPPSLPPFSSPSIACYFPHNTHTHPLLTSVKMWETDHAGCLFVWEKGHCSKWQGSNWNLSFSNQFNSTQYNCVSVCVCVALVVLAEQGLMLLGGGKGEISSSKPNYIPLLIYIVVFLHYIWLFI